MVGEYLSIGCKSFAMRFNVTHNTQLNQTRLVLMTVFAELLFQQHI